MRKALHEEVSKEITDKSVHIAVRLAKPVLEDFMRALKEVANKPIKVAPTADPLGFPVTPVAPAEL